MYIQRDITSNLLNNNSPVQLLLGPRQCGKSTLLANISNSQRLEKKVTFKQVSFDDLQLRNLANNDPALFLQQFSPPTLLDEVQYAPNLFPEIKLQIDQLKLQRIQNNTNEPLSTLFRMTGSNQILFAKNVKESLVGRASYFYLNTLTVHEIISAMPNTNIADILFRGGWPELYLDPTIPTRRYLNDYIQSYLEKDVVLSAGIQKQEAFNLVLGLLAARTGMLLDYADIAKDSGIQAVTVKEWSSVLQATSIVYCLKPFASNLNKRLIKTPKLYFLDTGLAARLQGWQEQTAMLTSPQAGALFETLVFAEIYKFMQNYAKNWQIYFWRTREGQEIDFVISTGTQKIIALEAKLSRQGVKPIELPDNFKKLFPMVDELMVVTFGGQKIKISKDCTVLPIAELHDFLLTLD